MPETVWDYVAKLKTSVNKASSTQCILSLSAPNILYVQVFQYHISCFVCFLRIRSYV